MHKLYLILLFKFCLIIHFGVQAKDISYDELLDNQIEFVENDKIILGEAHDEARFIKLLGAGNTTRVYEVEYQNQRMALRIPKSRGKFNTFSSYEDYIDAFYMGHEALRVQGINIPKIYEYKEDSFLLVEKLKIENGFELKDFFFYKDKLNPVDYENAKEALEEFVRSIAAFKEIKDFHLKQAVYYPETGKWILVDWTPNHELFEATDDIHPLPLKKLESLWNEQIFFEKGGRDNNGRVPPLEIDEETKQLFNKIDEIVASERKQILELESQYLVQLKQRLADVNSIGDFINLINSTPENHSKNYISAMIDLISENTKFSLDQYIDHIPYYLIANNKDFENFLLKSLTQVEDLQTLDQLLKLRLNKGMNVSWNLTMGIQKLITTSTEDTPIEVYESLMESKLVSDFAKAWIKRERFDKIESISCKDAVKSFF
jgi:hypothetical protein